MSPSAAAVEDGETDGSDGSFRRRWSCCFCIIRATIDGVRSLRNFLAAAADDGGDDDDDGDDDGDLCSVPPLPLSILPPPPPAAAVDDDGASTGPPADDEAIVVVVVNGCGTLSTRLSKLSPSPEELN